MNRCDAAWDLYNQWCDVYLQLSTATPQEVIRLKTLSAYLESELRSHLRTCRDCQSYIYQTVEVSNEFEKSVSSSGQTAGDETKTREALVIG